ncbi:MAG TPA: NADH-quinone oxidoreductase subunit J [Candidatus Polarisedimenticolia bacterium]|nr:NADH-quinone oxidoreductase subunit J [Candidatus Polarisedimenticolia bacterium]
MTAAALIFYVLASIALISAGLVIWSRNSVHSAIYLVLTFLCVAAIYVLLQAEFVAAVQVLVYAGGIMVLFLFVIMLVSLTDTLGPRVRLHATLSSVIGASVVGLILSVYARGDVRPAGVGESVLRQGGNLQNVGLSLYRDYLLPFEIASILLLVAMIGAIVLARQKS